jgi:hypothetical protein
MASIDSIMSQQGIGRGEPGPAFSEAFPWGQAIVAGATDLLDVFAPRRTSTVTDTSKQTDLGPAGIQELIYQALSGQGGVSAIKSGEAASGGFGSSSGSLMIADLMANTAAQISQITAPKTTHEESRSKKKKSAVCTALNIMGELPDDLYSRGQDEFGKLPLSVIRGYYSWAVPVAMMLPKSKLLTVIFKYVAMKRYEYVLGGRLNLVGWTTVKIGEPLCGFFGKH